MRAKPTAIKPTQHTPRPLSLPKIHSTCILCKHGPRNQCKWADTLPAKQVLTCWERKHDLSNGLHGSLIEMPHGCPVSMAYAHCSVPRKNDVSLARRYLAACPLLDSACANSWSLLKSKHASASSCSFHRDNTELKFWSGVSPRRKGRNVFDTMKHLQR